MCVWAVGVSITHTASAKVLELKAFIFPLTGKLVVSLLLLLVPLLCEKAMAYG